MSVFLCVRLIHEIGMVVPNSKGYGEVEIFHSRVEFLSERNLLIQSVQAFDETVNIDISQRISTIINESSPIEADRKAETIFKQLLENIDRTVLGIGNNSLLKSGYIRELETGWESPRLPNNNSNTISNFQHIFLRKNRELEHIDQTQALFSFPDSELKQAILRSSHWIRNGKFEENLQIKCLFNWFSLECVTKVGEDNIVPKLMQSIGFPLGKSGMFISKEQMDKIKSHPKYEYGKKYFDDKYNEIREFRNKSVHHGFRQWDIEEQKLTEYVHILSRTNSRLYTFVLLALYYGLATITELWEYIPILYSERYDDIINDFHGNILYEFISDFEKVNESEIKFL